MPAQRHDPAARAPDVAEQQLDDRRGPDVLHADRVLGPADRVAERGGALAAGVVAQRLGDLVEQLARNAADLLHQLGRVAAEVPAQQLEDAARVLRASGRCGAARRHRAVGAVGLLPGRPRSRA